MSVQSLAVLRELQPMQARADYLDVLRDDRKVIAGKFGRVA